MPDDGGFDGISVVPVPTRQRLNERQVQDYHHHRTQLIRWLDTLGKDPDRADGYAHDTVRRRAHDLDVFYRYVWDHHTDGYSTAITTDHADAYCQQLAYQEHSDSHRANVQKSLKCYFRWRDIDYEPSITFSGSAGQTTQPRDHLTRDERRRLREAALEYGTVPTYNSLTPTERSQWQHHLAQRFRKPADEITPDDFKRANGFKIPSIVYASLDAALRPVEVGRARPSWVDTDNCVLRIPSDDAAKNRDNWTVSIREDTTRMISQWLDERTCYSQYDDSDHLWLTRESQPYSSRSLNYLLEQLCAEAAIDTDDRHITWYAIRHSTGTYMAREEGLAAASAQLRHSSVSTTRKYDNAPTKDRRDALDRID